MTQHNARSRIHQEQQRNRLCGTAGVHHVEAHGSEGGEQLIADQSRVGYVKDPVTSHFYIPHSASINCPDSHVPSRSRSERSCSSMYRTNSIRSSSSNSLWARYRIFSAFAQASIGYRDACLAR